MASNIIGEAILIIASVIVAGSVAGIVMSKIGVFESTVTSTSDLQQEKMLTKLAIIYASNSTATDAEVWVKNIGRATIFDLDKIDVYFGEINAVDRYAYEIGTADQTWEIDGGLPSTWDQMETLQINIDEDDLDKDVTYFVRVTTPNGVSDDYIFSLP